MSSESNISPISHGDNQKQSNPRSEFDFVIPQRLDNEGKFLTHDVHFVIPSLTVRSPFRSRRHVDASHLRHANTKLFYNVSFGGKVLLLNLTENHDIINGDFILERIFSKKNASSRSVSSDMYSSTRLGTRWRCQFNGHIEGIPGSKVAMSTCNGLVSTFQF